MPDGSDELICALDETNREGRQTLFVLGAGCSVAAGVPQMKEVYQYLSGKVRERSDQFSGPVQKRQFGDLVGWLQALEQGTGTRSIAAKALGTMQRSDELSDEQVRQAVADLWRDFSSAFIKGQVASEKSEGSLLERPPTKFHELVAEFVLARKALAVSVNFDGLTRKAVRNLLRGRTDGSDCVILNSPKNLARYALGEAQATDRRLHAIVKVWGDVFHAVCRQHQCPEFDNPVPVYDLPLALQVANNPSSAVDASIDQALRCPECHSRRQLQVFFTGYQQKERDTQLLMEALWQFYGTQIGCVLIAGMSGEWDDALVAFLAELARNVGRPGQCNRVFCVDPSEAPPFIVSELTRAGASISLIRSAADELATACAARPIASNPIFTVPKSQTIHQQDREYLWESLLKKSNILPNPPYGYAHAMHPSYLTKFRQLRQLGIKTKIKAPRDADEQSHNRYVHSLGTCHVALFWISALLQNNKHTLTDLLMPDDLIKNMVAIAAMHHDLGHLPFTHLMEEVFEELHWSLHPWTDVFQHDNNVLNTAHSDLADDANKMLANIAAEITGYSPEEFKMWLTRGIEGWSGLPFVDAILNSPLDADKIDYIFRDCLMLETAIHLPMATKATMGGHSGWLEEFVTETQEVLPSGTIALHGRAGEHARQLLEERRWLYKHLYLKPLFRVVERIARSVITFWLVHSVSRELAHNARNRAAGLEPFDLSDVRSLKGGVARQLLWKRLGGQGEPEMILAMAKDLLDTDIGVSDQCNEWVRNCSRVLETMLSGDGGIAEGDLIRRLTDSATWSQKMYVRFGDLKQVVEIVRELEFKTPFSAVIDIAKMPRMLSYPNRRRLRMGGSEVVGECFAVSHRDPDRWGKKSGMWIPLAQSAYAEIDEHRWAQLLVVSPRPHDDANVRHVEDRLRNRCARDRICVLDEDPDTQWSA